MKTKKIGLALVVMLFTTLAFSQNYSPKLLVKYTESEVESLKQDNLQEFELINYFVTEGYNIIDMPDKPIDYVELKKIDPKTGDIMEGEFITDADLDNFNPLEYNCTPDAMKRGYYKAGNTGKLIIVPTRPALKNRIENKKRINNNK
ncbi:MAG TPA: hypothetical protein VJ946_12490 [Bacteroidales bacterium]|nr:hypothetical protein [Bacteroidales bacterium]